MAKYRAFVVPSGENGDLGIWGPAGANGDSGICGPAGTNGDSGIRGPLNSKIQILNGDFSDWQRGRAESKAICPECGKKNRQSRFSAKRCIYCGHQGEE